MGKTALLLLALAGCAHKSEAERCRTAAAFQTDPALREAALGRCEVVAMRESAERMHAEDLAARQRERDEAETAELVRRSQVSSPAPPPPQARPVPACVASEDAWLFPSMDAAHVVVDAARQGVAEADIEALMKKLGVRAVREGTRCRVMGEPEARPLYPVTLLEGELVGERGWMVLDQAEEAAVVHKAPY